MHVLQQITGYTDKRDVYTIIDIDALLHSWCKKKIPLVIVDRIEKFTDLNGPLYETKNNDTNNNIKGQLCILLTVFIFLVTLGFHISFPHNLSISWTDPTFVDYKPDFRDPLWPQSDIYFIETEKLDIGCNFMISGRYQFISTSNGVFTYRKPFGHGDIIIDAHHTQITMRYIGDDTTLKFDFVYNKQDIYMFMNILSIKRCDGIIINDIDQNVNDFKHFSLILSTDSIHDCSKYESNNNSAYNQQTGESIYSLKDLQQLSIFIGYHGKNRHKILDAMISGQWTGIQQYKIKYFDNKYLDFLPGIMNGNDGDDDSLYGDYPLYLNNASQVVWNKNLGKVCTRNDRYCYQIRGERDESVKHSYGIICPNKKEHYKDKWFLYSQRFDGGFDYLRNYKYLYHEYELTKPIVITVKTGQ